MIAARFVKSTFHMALVVAGIMIGGFASRIPESVFTHKHLHQHRHRDPTGQCQMIILRTRC